MKPSALRFQFGATGGNSSSRRRGRGKGSHAARTVATLVAGAAVTVGGFGVRGVARADRGKKTGKVRVRSGAKLESKLDISKIFEDLDVDKSGEIDEDEIRVGLRQLGLPSGDDYVADLLTLYDLDKSKTISKEEFIKYVQDKEKQMHKVFKEMDVDFSGSITSKEIIKVMKGMGINANPSDGDKMIEVSQ